MSLTPFEYVEGVRVGTVDFVSPDEIKVSLDIESPESVALNAGSVRPFPRVNGYLLVTVDEGYLVGQIGWLTIERSPFPKRRGLQDFGLIDLPYPLRRLSMNPLGMLTRKDGDNEAYSFRRGADSLPSLGSAVLLPTELQLRSIVESGERRRVRIGSSPLAANAEVCVDPDRLFGRHVAVLGNTGSGKSCSVAGLIRWSLEAASAEKESVTPPNSRFIILDPNGEYSRPFSTDSSLGARVFRVDPRGGEQPLQVPLWLWDSSEWASFSQASAKTQRPLLKRALREVKSGRIDPLGTDEGRKLDLRRYLTSSLITIQRFVQNGAIRSESSKFGRLMCVIRDDLSARAAELPGMRIERIVEATQRTLDSAQDSFVKAGKTITYYQPFSENSVAWTTEEIRGLLGSIGGVLRSDGPDEDVPLPFDGTALADHLQTLSIQENAEQYIDFFISRIRTFVSDQRIRSVVEPMGSVTLDQWLNAYIGEDQAKNGCVAVIDLSLVPSEIIHIVIAVTARIIFEALQRFRRLNQTVLPTVIVMEEAHTFIKKYREGSDSPDVGAICCQVFERIAREGRKFGLGLVLSSQRPSELSPTVLSQCNTFLLHRISNDRDQELVQRLVPDNLRGLLRELPSLPSQHAILLGWASELPVLVRLDDLPSSFRPRSDDPDFWDVWTGMDAEGAQVLRSANWKDVADEWQGIRGASSLYGTQDDAQEPPGSDASAFG